MKLSGQFIKSVKNPIAQLVRASHSGTCDIPFSRKQGTISLYYFFRGNQRPVLTCEYVQAIQCDIVNQRPTLPFCLVALNSSFLTVALLYVTDVITSQVMRNPLYIPWLLFWDDVTQIHMFQPFGNQP